MEADWVDGMGKMSETENIRLLALETLLEVEKKKLFVKEALHRTLFQKQYLKKQDRAFLTRLVEGVTEYQIRLDYMINSCSNKDVNRCKPAIRCILRMGVYQMFYMDSVPKEAACNESVKLAKKKGFHNLSGFVNGVLRSVERSEIAFPEEKDLTRYLSVTYSVPEWLVDRLCAWYGETVTRQILEASLQTDDLTIRVNTARITTDELEEKLREKGITVHAGRYVKEALHLEHINYVNRIPGFRQGAFFVQDESSMLLFHLAGWKRKKEPEKLRILDICAAPGGKCTHFAERMLECATIEARDVSENKVSMIRENIKRLGLSNIQTTVWDARVPDEDRREWADIVLADLPCSGLGILSKKNDIKYHVTPQQLEELVRLQRMILTNAASYVKPGGLLLYSTCTINPEENRDNADWFLQQFPFEREPLTGRLPDSLKQYVEDETLQILPGQVDCDGFFIAGFRRRM